jgi:hypothetical protein
MLPAFLALFSASAASADPLKCDVNGYKSLPGLSVAAEQDVVTISWSGQGGSELRARYAIDAGQPVVRELAVKKPGGQWSILGQNLTPEYRVVTGVRRMTEQQAQPLRAAGVELTQFTRSIVRASLQEQGVGAVIPWFVARRKPRHQRVRERRQSIGVARIGIHGRELFARARVVRCQSHRLGRHRSRRLRIARRGEQPRQLDSQNSVVSIFRRQ